MRRTILAALAVLALAMPATATDSASDQLDHIDALIEADDRAALYEAYLDDATAPSCRFYIDAALGVLVVADGGIEYPELNSIRFMFTELIETAGRFRNDCLLAT